MLNKSYKSFLGLAVGLFALLSLGACVDQEFDTPSPRALTDVVPADSQYKNIGTLKNMYESYIQKNPNKLFWRVEENIALKAVISMDGKTSNIYKQVFIQDPAGQTDAVQGMALAVTGSNPYTQGNLIHINLKGNVVTKKNGLYQIGGDYFADYPKDPDHPKGSKVQAINSFEKVFWEKSSVELAPKTLTIAQIKSNKNNQGILVKIEDARFLEDDKKTFSEAPQKDISYPFTDHKLKDATGVIEVKTSKFANFRDELVPTGQGTFIGIIGYYESNKANSEDDPHQLYIRSPKELNMKGAVTPVEPVKPVNPGSGEYVGKTTSFCLDNIKVTSGASELLSEDFSSSSKGNDFTQNNWSVVKPVGKRNWFVKVHNNNKYVQAGAFKSDEPKNESWLISPEINFDAQDSEKLSFQSAMAYWEHGDQSPVKVYIIKNFNGNSISGIEKEEITTAKLAKKGLKNYAWVDSGSIDLSHVTGTARIAFQYIGGDK